MTKSPERVLIVGFGSIGRRHARLIRDVIPDAEVCVLRRKATTEPLPATVDRCVTTLEDALRFSPQAAVIAHPAPLHLDAATPLAEAGVHLLVEKPISHTTEGVAALIELCAARGLVLMTGYNLRYTLSLAGFRDLLRAGRVGRVLSVRSEVGQFLPAWRPSADYRQTVSARSDLGGGVLLELSHDIDCLRWLFGEVQSVSATLCRQSDLEIDVEDTAHLVLTFVADGAGPPVVASLNMDFIRQDATRYCVAIGDSGSLRWDGTSGEVAVFERAGSGWQVIHRDEANRDAAFLAEWRDFVACIGMGGTPRVSGHDGLAVLRVIAAARESYSRGCVAAVRETVEPSSEARAE